MLEEQNTSFNVRFLGGFFLEFDGKPIRIVKNLRQKRIQMLLILLKAGKEGVSYRRLIEMLEVEGEYFEKKLSNLRSQISKLRKFISETGFPESSYLPTIKGRYYFNLEYAIESDTGKIDRLYKRLREQLDPNKREAWLREICSIYQGEFLPSLAAEEWAVVENSHYHEIYQKCLKELGQILKKQRDYTELLQLCTKACRLHPYDGWQALRIDCLIAQEKYQEAQEVSRKANEMFEKELGVVPFRKRVGAPIKTEGRASLLQVMEELVEEESSYGAYECSYPHFIDACQLLMRISEREGNSILLLLCTLSPESGSHVKETSEKRQVSERQMEQFGHILAGLVRNQDVYTRYSKNQFLAILTVDGDSGISFLSRRLCWGWREFEKREGLTVELEIQTLNTFAREEVM